MRVIQICCIHSATHKTPRECGGGGSHRLRLHSRSWFSARRGDVGCGKRDALRVEWVIFKAPRTQTVAYTNHVSAVVVGTVPSGPRSGPRRSFGRGVDTHYATHYGKDRRKAVAVAVT